MYGCCYHCTKPIYFDKSKSYTRTKYITQVDPRHYLVNLMHEKFKLFWNFNKFMFFVTEETAWGLSGYLSGFPTCLLPTIPYICHPCKANCCLRDFLIKFSHKHVSFAVNGVHYWFTPSPHAQLEITPCITNNTNWMQTH